MARDQFERSRCHFATGRNFVPGRCTGRMRQRNYVKVMSGARNLEFSANYVRQSFAVDELRDSQPPHGNDETRLQDLNLIVHPRRAVANLARRRNAIRAAGIFSGKTPADCREINLRADGGLVHRAEFFEPTKKRFTSSVRERSLQNRFPRAGRLTNDHDVADDCAARDWRRFHTRAAPATQQCRHVSIELSLDSCCSHGPVGRSHTTGQHARSDGPQARGYSASDITVIET
jgi:hypothetical protein